MMIGQQTMVGYITQLLILGQPFAWMWMYDNNIRVPNAMKYFFYLVGFEFMFLVTVTGFGIGFYTTDLLIQYVFFTMGATFLYNQRNPIKEAVSLAFLTVFLNSLYWEFPLHIAEILSGLPHMGMLVQLWRLVPAFWFLGNYTFDDRSKRTLAKGLLFSLILNAIAYLQIGPRPIIHAVIRGGCLLFLVKTIVEARPKEEGLNIGTEEEV